MRVKLLRTIGGRPDLQEGCEADVDDAVGDNLCRRGLAERLPENAPAVIEAVPEPSIQTVPHKSRRKKRGRHNA